MKVGGSSHCVTLVSSRGELTHGVQCPVLDAPYASGVDEGHTRLGNPQLLRLKEQYCQGNVAPMTNGVAFECQKCPM